MDELRYECGRPTKFNEIVLNAILEGIAGGLTLKAACRAASISYSTLAYWRVKARKAKKAGQANEYTDMFEKIQSVASKIWIDSRCGVLHNLKPRDYRYGWKKSS